MEKSEIFSLEEVAKMKQERTLSDAELIKGGASYIATEQGGLELTKKQKEEIRMEHEGDLWPDAATYVKINKKIVLPAEDVPETVREQKGKGWIADKLFRYIDKDGNLARVDIDYEKILSFAKRGRLSSATGAEDQLKEELGERGFDIAGEGRMPGEIAQAIHTYEQKVREQMKEKAKREFDF